MRKILYFVMILLTGVFSACKKHKVDPDSPDAPGSTLDLIKDSIYLYTKEAYYWSDGIPDYATIKPRTINGSNDLAAVTAEVNLLSQFKINPATGQPYEYVSTAPGQAKYSFIDNGQTSAVLGGTKVDFGFAITAISSTDFRVRYVYAGSAAGNNGMHRGEMITAINGRTGLDLNVNADYSFVLNALGVSPINMTLKRGDNTTYSVTLTSASYTVNPVLLYKVFDQGGGKKVGYMVFNSFTAPANAQPKLDEAFASFTSAGITDLVVDLRYNGGGYVSTAESLSNMIVPTAKNGTLMYNTYFNSTLQSGQEQMLKHQFTRDATNGLYNLAQVDYSVTNNAVKFSKKGTLNISRVFFIVTGSTASASELAINNLRPQMDVRLIGPGTYGKPVGFFALNINQYQLYVPEFETKNAANQGGYYTGMTPGSADYPGYNDKDDITKDFGDATEGLLAHALNYVKTGTYGTSLKIQSADGQPVVNRNVGSDGFNGMIMDKGLKIKK
ncbi:MAG: S41 family peptidase [Bacteroidota bacterium]